ncbi:hypothetical protein HAX54_037508 [Datura stramonium]|uniref:Germin-like protein n=1 Tax=Datura stramonium TaxID=4076 RepID=A0ABS8SH10_DATST|nr:hypothetical protein [Datura stramonium]
MALLSSMSLAFDPSPLQDFYRVTPTPITGLNTGHFLARIDYALIWSQSTSQPPGGNEVLPPEGTLYVGLSFEPRPNMKNKLFTKILHPGDVFVFPIGLIHFQFNVGKTKAVAFADQ